MCGKKNGKKNGVDDEYDEISHLNYLAAGRGGEASLVSGKGEVKMGLQLEVRGPSKDLKAVPYL